MADFGGDCEIRTAGVSPEGLAQVELKALNGTFDWTMFLSADALSREILATALAALVANKRVACHIQGPVAQWARITRFLMVKY